LATAQRRDIHLQFCAIEWFNSVDAVSRLRDVAMTMQKWIDLEEFKQPGTRRVLEAIGRIRAEMPGPNEETIESDIGDVIAGRNNDAIGQAESLNHHL
jgi:hypothetical protein